jgi:hypothetical protein
MRAGMMSECHYRYIAATLLSKPGSLLVFGLGHDADLWRRCIRVTLGFVEDDPRFLITAPATAIVAIHEFSSRVGVWTDVPPPPSMIARAWDYVLVDGPKGHSRKSPGRQHSIAWARQLARRSIFVHDYGRQWDRKVCDRILGRPKTCLQTEVGRRGQLAVFDVSNSASALTDAVPATTVANSSLLSC